MSCTRRLALLLLACPVPAVAQQSARWGDELPAPQAWSVALRRDTAAWPAPPLGAPPRPVRGLYVNAWAFGSSRFERLLDLVDGTEVNSLVIDVKDDTGYLTYRSSVPTAVAIGANGQLRARDTRARLDAMRARGLHPIARIVVAKDPLLAARRPGWAIQHREGGLWRDRAGNAWVDAFQDSVWIYAAALAEEAVCVGFAEIQYDYVRFPDEPPSRRASAVFPGRRDGESLRDGVADGLRLLQARTRALGVPCTIDVFGLTTSVSGDLGIGQVWEDLVSSSDAVLPMVYPSHYRRGEYGVAHPNADPYAVVHRALRDAQRRSASLGHPAEIRPYLQAFTLGAPRYSPEQVRAQVRAARALGIEGWVLWNPRSVYEKGQIVSEPRVTTLAATAR
ncbi:MAG: putative glycoside hydrolase [Gemmatimonadales bacterium]|nr:putative glycoside hydrolase [Gemmatimonadales bacterium]